MKALISLFMAMSLNATTAFADNNALDEINPFDANIEETLLQMDQDYEEATGESAILGIMKPFGPSCYQVECPVWVNISKATQTMDFYVNGILQARWPVSTGAVGFGTPDFDQNPNGRIYDAYTSTKYPGGDYEGLGNMPYAIFISGGFAIHGTGQGNWKKLGSRASHGCIRLHPDNAKIVNRLVRQYGIYKTWITVR